MNANLLNKVEQFVTGVFTKAEKSTDVIHAQKTVGWIKKLKPEADGALIIAGWLHDIERAFYGDWKKGSDDQAALRKHQDLSSSEAEKFLKSVNADEKLIARVVKLIANHEIGGDEEANVLCDADCLAFMEEKALRLAKKAKLENNVVEVKRRIEMVWNRIHSEKAKRIALKWYDEAMKELNKQ